MISVVSVQLLKIIRSLGQLKVSQSQIAQSEILISNKFVQLLQLSLDLIVIETTLFSIVVRRVEHVDSRVKNVLQHEQNHLYLRLILDCLAQQLSLLRFTDNVICNSHRFSQLKIPINQVRKVGEIETQFVFIPNSEPIPRLLVGHLLPIKASIGQQMTNDLAAPPESPVPHFDLSSLHKIRI